MAGLGDLFTALNNIAANLGKLVAQTSLAIVVPISQGGTGATTAAGARTNFGLGTMATQNANAVAITGGTISAAVTGGSTPGGEFLSTGGTVGPSGLVAFAAPLLGFKNADGTGLAAAAAAGKFGISVTLGTSELLAGESATSATKTDSAITEIVLPPWYIGAQDVTLLANCAYALSGGGAAIGTHTLAATAYLTATNGTQGSTLIATVAQTVPNAAGDVTFTITGATLLPSSRLVIRLTMVIQETGGGAAVGSLNSVRLS